MIINLQKQERLAPTHKGIFSILLQQKHTSWETLNVCFLSKEKKLARICKKEWKGNRSECKWTMHTLGSRSHSLQEIKGH